MALIEKSRVLRKIPTGGTNDAIGTLRLVDPITGDEITQEQFGSVGYPARFVKIADKVSGAVATYPVLGAIAIAANANPALVQFSGALACSPIGLLLWIKQAGANQHQVRKITSLSSGTTYNLNAALPAALTGSESYDLLVDTFRFNAVYLKAEFDSTAVDCEIQPIFYSVNQNPENPTPGTAAPLRFQNFAYRILNTGQTTDATEAGYYHGSVVNFSAQGALGIKIRTSNVFGSGLISLWATAI